MNTKDLIRLSFVGESGSGKNFVADLAADTLANFGYSVIRLDVAEPLHSIQSFAYSLFGLNKSGQDARLLEFLASHFEPQLPIRFAFKYAEAVDGSSLPLAIVNADCRDNSYLTLSSLRFMFVLVSASPETRKTRLLSRGDSSQFNPQNTVNSIQKIKPDFEIQNDEASVTVQQTQNLVYKLLSYSI